MLQNVWDEMWTDFLSFLLPLWKMSWQEAWVDSALRSILFQMPLWQSMEAIQSSRPIRCIRSRQRFSLEVSFRVVCHDYRIDWNIYAYSLTIFILFKSSGPVAAGVNAEPLVDYTGGIVKDRKMLHKLVNHVVSIVGWGNDGETEYWIVRNSWGQYW